jgi:hypothetical protein
MQPFSVFLITIIIFGTQLCHQPYEGKHNGSPRPILDKGIRLQNRHLR